MKHVNSGLITYTLKPTATVAEAIDAALAKKSEGKKGVEEAIAILEEARKRDPKDPRLAPLINAMRASLSTSVADEVKGAQRAFANLAAKTKQMRAAAESTSRVHAVEGGEPSAIDRRMMKAVVKLAERPFAEGNTPAASILALEGKVVSVGVNRAYAPLYDWRRHGEMEAFAELPQRIYGGMANVLILYRQSGGQLPDNMSTMLDKLERQGVSNDAMFIDTAASLKKGGFFAQEKIERYSRDLEAFVKEGGFIRDEDGNINGHLKSLFKDSVDSGVVNKSDLADWSLYDRLHVENRTTKMTCYTSLEPCGMCLQNCTSAGSIGRIVFGATDAAGGCVSILDHYPELYYGQGRMPFEILGGVEGQAAQQMYDTFFRDIYPKVRAQQAK